VQAAADRPQRRFPRPFLFALAFLVLAGVAFVFLWPEIRVRAWIGALDDDPHGKNLTALVQSTEERTDDLLVDAVHDEDRSFRTRHLAAVALVRRQRLLPLERAVADESVGTRAVVLAALASQRYLRHYVRENAARADEAIAWLLASKDPHAVERGLQLVRELALESHAPRVRAILESRRAGPDPSATAEALAQAGEAAVTFRDCAAIEAMLGHAESSESLSLRRRMLQQVHRATRGPDAPCAAAVPEERIRAAAVALLGHDAKEARMTALIVLTHEPEWTRASAADVRGVLASSAPAEVRRYALTALLAADDETTTASLARWLHDDEEELRAQAVRSIAAEVRDGVGDRLGCLVGVVRNETRSFVAFEDAVRALRGAAGEWVGLPQPLAARATSPEFRDVLRALFESGEHRSGGRTLDRDAWSDAWFAWLAERTGVEKDRIPAALEARAAFYAAMRDDDVVAARAALPPEGDHPPGLFCWERAWLAAK
jgi:hypothetical protein